MIGSIKYFQEILHNLQLKNNPNKFREEGIAREEPLTLGKGSFVYYLITVF